MIRSLGTRHLLATVAMVVASGVLWHAPRTSGRATLVPGSESAEVGSRLRSEFSSPLTNVAVVLLEGFPVPVTTDSGRALVRRVAAAIGRGPGITAVVSPASALDTLLHSHDGTSALAMVGFTDDVSLDGARRRTDEAVAALRRDGVDLAHGWTGEQPLLAAVHDAMLGAIRGAEVIAVPLTFLAGWWAFGTWVTGLLALLISAGAVISGLAAVRLMGASGQSGPIAEALVVLVGTALTLDYLLWRSRGGLARGSILRAAGCAAIAFGALLLAPTPELRGAAIGGLVGVAVATAAAMLWSGQVRPVARSAIAAPVVDRSVRHPWPAAVGGIVALAALGGWGMMVPAATRPDRWLPVGAEATVVLSRLEAIDRGASVAPITVLVPMPDGLTVFEVDGWAAMQGAVSRLRAVEGIADVRAITEMGTRERTVTELVLPATVRSVWVSSDERVAAVQLLPRGGADTLVRTVASVRDAAGPGMLVGGLGAVAADHATAMRAAFLPLISLIAGGTVLALLLVFGAPLLAMKAVVVDLLVAGAALGVVALLHPSVRLDGFPVTIPLLALGAAFALSIDYELLLLFAVRDRRTAGDPERVAIVEGTTTATPMMLRGAAMLVALFAAFALQSFAPLSMTGTVLLAALVLDITLVRLIVAPALLSLWGEWNWWPGTRTGASAPDAVPSE